jgi:hypothetical protein
MKKIFDSLFRIPLSFILIITAAAVVGVTFHSWELATGTAVFSAWTSIPLLSAGPFCDTPRYVGPYKPLVLNGEFTPETFADMVKALRDQVNSMLAGLPPLEQYEAASDLSFGMRALQNSAANLIQLATGLEDAVKQYATKLTGEAEQKAEAKLLEKGEYVKKTDAETAQQTALTAKEKEIKDGIESASKEKERVTAARTKLVEAKVCSKAAAEALSADFFKEEGYNDRLTKLTARLKVLVDNKISHSDAFVAEMVGIPLDAEGDKTFEARVNSVKSLVGSSASRSNAGGGGASPSLAIPPEGEAAVPALCF